MRETDVTRVGGLAGLLAAVSLIVSLIVQAFIIVSSPQLGREPTPEDIAAFLAQHRLALAVIGALLLTGAFLFLLLLRGVHAFLGTTRLSATGVAVGLLGALGIALFGSGGLLSFTPPEFLISNLTDALLGLAFLLLGAAMLRDSRLRAWYGWTSVGMGSLLLIASGTIADPHLAQLFLIIWSIALGLKTRTRPT